MNPLDYFKSYVNCLGCTYLPRIRDCPYRCLHPSYFSDDKTITHCSVIGGTKDLYKEIK